LPSFEYTPFSNNDIDSIYKNLDTSDDFINTLNRRTLAVKMIYDYVKSSKYISKPSPFIYAPDIITVDYVTKTFNVNDVEHYKLYDYQPGHLYNHVSLDNLVPHFTPS
jgi:hypothetical protein